MRVPLNRAGALHRIGRRSSALLQELGREPTVDEIAEGLDDFCIEEGAFRYMHTRTGRDPARMAQFDPNAMYNDGVSFHPYDRPLGQ